MREPPGRWIATADQDENAVAHYYNLMPDARYKRCRKCKAEDVELIFNDAEGNPTKTPLCQECYERLVCEAGRDDAKRHQPAHLPEYRTKDPDHDHLNHIVHAWWEQATRDWPDESEY